jgi:hypothetical protein
MTSHPEFAGAACAGAAATPIPAKRDAAASLAARAKGASIPRFCSADVSKKGMPWLEGDGSGEVSG